MNKTTASGLEAGDPRLPPRFWSKVRVDANSGCWLWTGVAMRKGYGQFHVAVGGARFMKRSAHRVAFEALVRPISDGLELDHLCRVRPCCNPMHLEPVTHAENVRRAVPSLLAGAARGAQQQAKTHCPHRHLYDETNTRIYVDKKGRAGRYCRECHRLSGARRRAARNAR